MTLSVELMRNALTTRDMRTNVSFFLRALTGSIWLFVSASCLLGQKGVSAPLQAPAPQKQATGPDKKVERLRQFLGLGKAPDAVAAARGEKVYTANCAFCHGAKATGGEGPDLVRSSLVLHDENGEQIGPVILKGRPDRGMPSFSLTAEQVADVAAFLHMRVELAVDRALYKVHNVVTGDATAGKAFFNGPGKCNSCHSPAGDLAHIGSKFEPSDLQGQFLYPTISDSKAGAASSPAVTVTLRNGQSIRGTLKRIDDFSISMFDSSGAYRSYSRDDVKVEVEDRLASHRKLLDLYTDSDMHNMLAYLVTLK
jgi:mono/diheme cytochrome c family protein